MLDADSHLERRTLCEPRRAKMRERDVLLQQRRPAAARGVADLFAAGIKRHAHPPGGARQAGGETDVGIEPLQRIPVELDAAELPLRAARFLLNERRAADEAFLGEVYGPAEVELEGR